MGASTYIRIHGDCQKVLQYPLLFGGLFIFVVSTLGLVGALCGINAAIYLYLLVTFFVVLAFSAFTIVALFVTRNNTLSSVVYGFGCCKPPLQCGFTKKNATFWEVPAKASTAANNTNCRTWSNRQDKLCFNCDSCKGGVLANIRSQWRHLTIFNACVLVLVTTIYVLGYYAIRNNRLEYSNYTTQRRKIGMRIPSTVI
ncbi:Tetraspanin-11 [Glycine max]|nr:Tetraspanin-11 [Glycine max]